MNGVVGNSNNVLLLYWYLPPTCMMYHAAAIISATARPSPLKINNGKVHIHSTIPCTVRVVDKCFVFRR